MVIVILLKAHLFAQYVDANKNGKMDLYENPKADIEERIKDLLSRMTLDEKIAQMKAIGEVQLDNQRGDLSERTITNKDLEYGIGQLNRSGEDLLPEQTVEKINKLQKYLLEKTRLGIPAIIHEECLHGVMMEEATIFPQLFGGFRLTKEKKSNTFVRPSAGIRNCQANLIRMQTVQRCLTQSSLASDGERIGSTSGKLLRVIALAVRIVEFRKILKAQINSLIALSFRFRLQGVQMTSRGMKYLTLISVLLLVSLSGLFGQSAGKISGLIRDAETGESLVGCNVIVLGTTFGASTDLEGSFFILNLPPGKYDLQASLIGYQKRVQTGVIVNSGRTTIADFTLRSSAVELDVVVVQAIRPDVEPEKTSTSVIVRTEDVQQLAGMRDVGDVIGLAADVMDGHFRGGRSNEELYSLQGMGLNNPIDNSRAIVPIMSAVEEVEVITSGFGAQYGNAQSGVVNITMKEGKSDKWRSFSEVRMRAPSRKHFGPSVYDPGANQYLRTFSDTSIWNRYWSQVIPHPRLHNDQQLRFILAGIGYQMARRDINRVYGDEIDYSVELSTGGPINEHMRMFIAFSNKTTHPTFPTEHPDVTYQVMGNVVSDLGGNASLRVSGAYSRVRSNSMPGDDDLADHRDVIWNMIAGVGVGIRSNLQLGLRFTHALSHSTFYEIKCNMLSLNRRSGGGVYIPDSLLNTVAQTGEGNWLVKYNAEEDLFTEGNSGGGSISTDDSKTYSLDASITSQITRSHLLNAGLQANFYRLDVDRWDNRSLTGPNQRFFRGYHARPAEASIYIQDKMEFQGMIANVGLRYDAWDQNRFYQPNLFVNQQLDSGMVKSSIVARLQPRVGVSFPVSASTVFHLNYGSFLQRPSFQHMYRYEPADNSGRGNGRFGNPSLKPQVTYQYDVGVTQGLGEGFTFDASGYYKNIKNLVQDAVYYHSYSYTPEGVPIKGATYRNFINRVYADIRGFRLQLSKRRGNLSGDINYQYSVSTGKSSSPGNAMPIIGLEGDETGNSLYAVPKRDLLLDFDRTHNLILNVTYRTDETWGFRVAGGYPLGNVTLSTNSFARSGRPYTYNPSGSTSKGGSGATMNMRMPAEYNTNIKLTKRVRDFFGSSATIYLEVFNLFNNKRLNYNYITGLEGVYFDAFHDKAIDAPDGVLFDDSEIKHNLQERGFNHSFVVYDNDPRSITFGITIDF